MEKPNDEEKKFITERVIKYIKKINSNINIESISIKILKYAGGLNNDNYKITIEKDSKVINEYFFKIYLKIKLIIRNLSQMSNFY